MRQNVISLLSCALAVGAAIAGGTRAISAASEVVLYSSDFATLKGNWARVSSSGAAGGLALSSADRGWSSPSAPVAAPTDYVEASFTAQANTSYHVWVRLQAGGGSKYNDSVWLQFSDAVDGNGNAVLRIGSTAALLVNGQSCDGCALSGWGWLDGAYWLQQARTIRFATSGTHTLRIQTREDGVQLDQIVISPAAFLSSPPGAVINDSIVVSKSLSATGTSSPYSATPAAIPGTIRAEAFDNGGEGIAYHDTSSGNTGGKFRSTDVDIESSSDGGYDVGWTTAGEWLNYTVNVSSSGAYTVGLRVASASGATLHVGFNGSSAVWSNVNIPATGGWQTWTTVNVPVTLGSGTQQMTLLFDNGAVNLNRVAVSTAALAPPPPPPPSGGTTLSVATWNIHINDSSETHARVAMDTLLAIGPRPDVIVIQEAYSTMFNTYIDELQQQTGKTWHGVFATHCQLGSWNGSSCTTTWYQGVGIFSTYPIANSSSTLFPYADCWTSARVALRAALNVNGTTLQVMTTHLQTGSCTDVAQARYSSMSKLKQWAANYSKPQIVAGDFNADPNQIDTTSGMLPAFLDTWSLVGSGQGFTAFVPSPTMKIDYWFTDAGLRAQPVSTQVYLGAGSRSDHYPVQTTFVVR
jgi:endonuclease/exonuclease/phosphatase family metal-dependent hydrolase